MVSISIIVSLLALAAPMTAAPAKKKTPVVFKCQHATGNFEIRGIDKDATLEAAPIAVGSSTGSGYPHAFENKADAIQWPTTSCAGEGVQLLELPVLVPEKKLHPTQKAKLYPWNKKPRQEPGYARIVYKVIGTTKEFCGVMAHDGSEDNYFKLCPQA